MNTTAGLLYYLLQRSRISLSTLYCRPASYKATLNSPVFPFPIEIGGSTNNLPTNTQNDLVNADFILHDGPPYANGPIHFGHALNKILKDFIVNFQRSKGSKTSFVPGWDCHGLPIELKAVGTDISLPAVDIREASFRRASQCMSDQITAFKELKIAADWNQCYSTLDPQYQATVIRAFYDLYTRGLIVREHKPVYWSRITRSAISDSELEFDPEHEDPSLYFLVELKTQPSWLPTRYRRYSTNALVWTTTPWTIAANEAVIFSPCEEYSVLLDTEANRILLVASHFVPSLYKLLDCAQSRFEPIVSLRGDCFENYAYEAPLGDTQRCYRLMPGDFVEHDKGTGFVHCAPAHGRADFDFARRHDLPLRVLVDEETKFTKEAGDDLVGLFVQEEGNSKVIRLLDRRVLALSTIRHSFPCEWRTKQPVITRLSEQWFIDTDKLKDMAKEAYAGVNVFPPERKHLMDAFIERRPFWCISRQRNWGVPIPVLFRKHRQNTEVIVDGDFIEAIATRTSKEGSDFWWNTDIPNSQLIPPACLEKWNLTPLIADTELVRGKDIFDVWFESGLSWRAVLPQDRVADVCVEGLDQFRGWFSSSLLLSVALAGRAPFKNLVVHGFTTDSEGRKMSKSLGNVLSPREVLTTARGCTDVLRRWVAASGLASNSVVSIKAFNAHTIAYKKLRNMFRFMLGNMHDLVVSERHLVPPSKVDLTTFSLLDKWCLCLVGDFCLQCLDVYYPQHRYESLIASCDHLVSRISNTYFNAVKDVLYCDAVDSVDRNAVQHTFLLITHVLRLCLGPILPGLATEIDSALGATLVDRIVNAQRSNPLIPIYQAAIQWSRDFSDLPAAVARACSLRQAITAQQNSSNTDERPLWPGPAINPLARLHIIILDGNGHSDSRLDDLKRLNEEKDAEGVSVLCKILRCASVRFGDTSEPDNCIKLRLDNEVTCNKKLEDAAPEMENLCHITCLLRVAHESTQCPRCRRYRSINKSLCARCAPLVPRLQQGITL